MIASHRERLLSGSKSDGSSSIDDRIAPAWRGLQRAGDARGTRWVAILAASVAAFLVDFGASTASADVIYKVTSLLELGVGPSYAYSVNSTGQVAGFSAVTGGLAHAFLTGPNGLGISDLGTLSGSGVSYAHSVNASGQVTGFSTATGGFTHAFLTGANGSGMTDLGTLGGSTSLGFAMNDSAQVTGYSTLTIAGKVQSHAFLSGPKGMTDLGTLGSGTYSTGYAINASGQVTGYSYLTGATGYYHAFLTMQGAMKDLGTLAGGTSSIGEAVNASGQVAGVSYMANGSYRAFLTEASGGTMHDLGTLTPGGSSYAYGANDKGQVVGYATTTSGLTDAFLYDKGRILDLNTLISPLPGVHLTEALAISNSGYIVAEGVDLFGQTHAYLLRTIPEPSSLASLLVGLACAGVAETQRQRRARAVRANWPSSWDECQIRS